MHVFHVPLADPIILVKRLYSIDTFRLASRYTVRYLPSRGFEFKSVSCTIHAMHATDKCNRTTNACRRKSLLFLYTVLYCTSAHSVVAWSTHNNLFRHQRHNLPAAAVAQFRRPPKNFQPHRRPAMSACPPMPPAPRTPRRTRPAACGHHSPPRDISPMRTTPRTPASVRPTSPCRPRR